MSDETRGRLSFSEAVEVTLGLAAMLAALYYWKPAAALFAFGALVFAFGVWGRRIV